jgi:hypothetical protein
MAVSIASRIMARTTLDLDPSVLRSLRHRSKQEHKSMGQVASEVLARALAEPAVEEPAFAWEAADLGVPLVDLEDKEALYGILDRSA